MGFSNEKVPLVDSGPSKRSRKKSYGGTDNIEADFITRKSKTDVQKDAKKIPLSRLFRYATFRDKVIITIGTIFAFIHGAGLPFLALVFGSMTNTFIQQAISGFANATEGTGTGSQQKNLINMGSPLFSTLNAASSSRLLFAYSETNYFSDDNSTAFNSTRQVVSPFEDEPLTQDEFAEFMTEYALYYVYIGLVVFVASFIQAVCWEWACERQTYRLRQEFFYQVIRQEISWFDEKQTGDLSIKLSDDLERVREGIGHKFSMVIQYSATFVAGFAVGFFTSWQLTLVIMSLTPLLAGTSAFTGRLIATQSAREQQKYGKAGAVAEEVLSCIRTVASFGGEKLEISRYEKALTEGKVLAIKKYQVMAVGVALVFFVMYASYALAFWYGCQLLNMGELTPGDIFTVFFSVLVGAFSLGNAVPFISTIAIAQGSGAVVFEIIDSIPDIDPYSKEGYVPDKVEGRIQFKNINFKYPSRPTVQILEDFNLNIDPGSTVAIVGSSGAGKSTVVSLIQRFYDPERGSVLLDGYDIRLLNLAWFRHKIGVVSQEPVLFGTSIYENIRYGREDVTPDEIVEAARKANAHDFISSLPQSYDTLVGERGAQLSGGQKQRIAIARALVRDPRILLLDEATSALDAKSESVVQDALRKAREGRTTIIIAHRLSTIKDADIIYAMKDGKIAESGSHAQLMAKEGLYFQLVTSQTNVDTSNEFSGNDASNSYDSHDSLSYSQKDVAFTDPSKFISGNGNGRRRKPKKRNGSGKLLSKHALPDPDRSRMIREAEELNAKFPGVWKILKLNKPEWHLLLFGAIGCIITGAITPIFAYFYAEMFATFALSGDALMQAGFFWSMMFLVLATASGFGFWLRTICVASAGEYMTMRLRLLSYTGIIRQPIGWFDKECNSPSRLTTRLARDAPIVKAAAGHRLATVIAALVTIIAAIGIAFFFGWQLALAIIAGFPILVVAGYIQIQVGKSGQKKDAVLMEDAGRTANETIANIQTVQSLCCERTFFVKYLDHLLPVYVEAHKQGLIYGLAFSFSEAVIFLIYAAAFRYGGYLIQVGVMDPTSVFRVFFAISFCAVSVGQMTSFVPDYTKANLAAALIFNLIEQKSKIDPFNPHGAKPKLDGRITFTDVIFRYPNRPDMPVLNGLSFDVQPGQTLALVGGSGCGKSTVISLIERFYDVLDGRVEIDGFDVRSLNVAHLRKHIGVVNQEPVLFDCTIRENIAYGYGDGTKKCPEEVIINAAKQANIHNFIISLPQGYDTFVGERGTQMSGGQKQRISIARALVRDPKILLLDEATSALDTESEKVVQAALDNAREGRTCIIVAHRLSTIQNADSIAVVHKGKIAEIGTHEQLTARKGMYYKLTKKQQISH